MHLPSSREPLATKNGRTSRAVVNAIARNSLVITTGHRFSWGKRSPAELRLRSSYRY